MKALFLFLFVSCVFTTESFQETTHDIIVSGSIQPMFNCWFLTYHRGEKEVEYNYDRIIHRKNIIFGYTSSFNTRQVIDITHRNIRTGNNTGINVVYPLEYNNQQSSMFFPGNSPYALIIRDTFNILKHRDGRIHWIINDKTATVTEKDIRSDTQCYNKYSQSCSTLIDGFCEDNSYCNGREVCYPNLDNDYTGQCMKTTEVIVCDNIDMLCNDTTLNCTYNNHDTVIVTQQPTNTYTPTERPTTISVVVLPTEEPTTETPDFICSNTADCIGYNSFCKGSFVCSDITSTCIQFDNSYDPCVSY